MKFQFIFYSFFLLNINVNAQIDINDDLNFYSDYEDFKILNIQDTKWTFFHSENQDFNGNGIIDDWENIKSTEIIEFELNNKAIEFELSRLSDEVLYTTIREGFVEGHPYDGGTMFNHANRNEIATWDYPYITSYFPGSTYEFEYDIYIPDDFIFETSNCNDITKANYELVGQWHISHEVMSGDTKPPISLRIQCDRWVISLNTNDTEESDIHHFLPGKVEPGKWVNWRFKFKLSHRKRGKIIVWRNGELVFEKKKFKNIFAKYAPDGKLTTFYFKIGIYKPHWWSRDTNVQYRRVLYDNIKIK